MLNDKFNMHKTYKAVIFLEKQDLQMIVKLVLCLKLKDLDFYKKFI